MIPRDLTYTTQEMSIHHDPAWYVDGDGALRVGELLAAFQEFFREHSEHWVERFQYKEAGPQLLLQAFLQRIVNGGGRIEREYGLGRMRTDLLLVWPPGGAGAQAQAGERRETQKVVIECKVLHRGLRTHPARRSRTDAGLHGPQRGGGRAPGGLRPYRGQVVGREDLPPRRGGGRRAGHGVGDVIAAARRGEIADPVTGRSRVKARGLHRVRGSRASRPRSPTIGPGAPAGAPRVAAHG